MERWTVLRTIIIILVIAVVVATGVVFGISWLLEQNADDDFVLKGKFSIGNQTYFQMYDIDSDHYYDEEFIIEVNWTIYNAHDRGDRFTKAELKEIELIRTEESYATTIH